MCRCYLLDPTALPTGGADAGFLHFYSPMAMAVQRTFYLLVTISLLAAADKYTRDQMVREVSRTAWLPHQWNRLERVLGGSQWCGCSAARC